MKKKLTSSSSTYSFVLKAMFISCFVLILIVCLYSLLLFARHKQTLQNNLSIIQPTAIISASSIPISPNDKSTTQTYVSKRFGYSFEYGPEYNLEILDYPSLANDYPDVKLVSKDSRVNNLVGNIITGVEISISVLINVGSDRKNFERPLSIYPSYQSEVTILDTPNFLRDAKLNKDESLIAYHVQRAGAHYFSVVDIFTKRLIPPYRGGEAAIRIRCLDPGYSGKCQDILPQFISSIRLPN